MENETGGKCAQHLYHFLFLNWCKDRAGASVWWHSLVSYYVLTHTKCGHRTSSLFMPLFLEAPSETALHHVDIVEWRWLSTDFFFSQTPVASNATCYSCSKEGAQSKNMFENRTHTYCCCSVFCFQERSSPLNSELISCRAVTDTLVTSLLLLLLFLGEHAAQ